MDKPNTPDDSVSNKSIAARAVTLIIAYCLSILVAKNTASAHSSDNLNIPFLDTPFTLIAIWVVGSAAIGILIHLANPVKDELNAWIAALCLIVVSVVVLSVIDANGLPASSIPLAVWLYIVGFVMFGIFTLVPALVGTKLVSKNSIRVAGQYAGDQFANSHTPVRHDHK